MARSLFETRPAQPSHGFWKRLRRAGDKTQSASQTSDGLGAAYSEIALAAAGMNAKARQNLLKRIFEAPLAGHLPKD
ncbi:hypothetical protein JM93_03355 [Roseibium hamelinense]|uniref:Uncharacterized protein n=1 Tax=Roseibium hamelinense TaxID=150831 RepID=A0A562SQ31_9HYPH|nr:hypothetical protein [Roseibium hamelinense]MTI44383.1 hypothetical protein [Roseibium hamelinense]TWI82840.1 hypothetical protein JM93_03355 [Roseibium hamelinense]